MGIAFTNAINRFTEHNCRLVTTEIRYNFYFEKDLHVPVIDPEGFEEIDDLLSKADLIHFHMLSDENMKLGPIDVRDRINGKSVVHHHHGHPQFRASPGIFREKYRKLKRKVLVSTPDLLQLLPEAVWQPNLVPIHDPLLLPIPPCSSETVRIGQAPTRKDLKNTRELFSVIRKLKKSRQRPALEVDLIENCLYSDCLKRKNACDIMFDHMQGYFGVSSLESLSQGKPVIAGLDGWNLRHIQAFSGCENPPWVIARSEEELEEALAQLISRPELRREKGEQSRRFMEASWSEPHVIANLLRFYDSV